jgi:hypothetical protein
MPDIEDYPGVLTARDPEEFADLVRAADPAAVPPADRARIASFAKEATWSARLTDFDRIVAKIAERGV